MSFCFRYASPLRLPLPGYPSVKSSRSRLASRIYIVPLLTVSHNIRYPVIVSLLPPRKCSFRPSAIHLASPTWTLGHHGFCLFLFLPCLCHHSTKQYPYGIIPVSQSPSIRPIPAYPTQSLLCQSIPTFPSSPLSPDEARVFPTRMSFR